MSDFTVKLPDVGEGVAEAELVSWLVAVGDTVTPESVLAEVMTDKATVEISSPVAGVVTSLRGEPGDRLAVGAPLVTIELDGSPANPRPTAATASTPSVVADAPTPRADRPQGGPRVVAAPAVRARARELGIDLAAVPGTGPDGRVLHADLDRMIGRPDHAVTAASGADEPRVETLRGVRRRIAERMTASWTQIPHITYVEAVDVTELEALRAALNGRERRDGVRLTLLPFLVRAIVLAVGEQPRLGSHFDGATGTLSTFTAVHVGIATQTDNGLMVPVVCSAQSRGLWELATEIGRVTDAARSGTAAAADLSGSTITVTSLGSLGGLVTTPIINQPEVAIVGVNKIETRPVWRDGSWAPRSIMNLSSSFDHRIVDGWDAATFIQRIKAMLEMPALLFVDG